MWACTRVRKALALQCRTTDGLIFLGGTWIANKYPTIVKSSLDVIVADEWLFKVGEEAIQSAALRR